MLDDIKNFLNEYRMKISHRYNTFRNYTIKQFAPLRHLNSFLQVIKNMFFLESEFLKKYLFVSRRSRIIIAVSVLTLFISALVFVLRITAPTTGERSNKYFNKGIMYFEEGKYPEAEIELKNTLQINPQNASANYYLGLTHIYLGRFKEAYIALSKAAHINPQNQSSVHIINALNQVLSDKKLRDLSNDEYSQSSREFNIPGRIVMAKLMLQIGEIDKASVEARRIYSHAPDSLYANIIMGDISKAKKLYGKARRFYVNASAADNNNFESHLKLGQLYVSDNEIEKAINEFQKALELVPEDAIVHEMLGDTYALSNRYDDAFKSYKKVYEINKNSPEALRKACKMLFYKVKIKEAQNYIEEYVNIAPDDHYAYFLRAISHSMQRRYAKALDDIKVAVDLNKQSLLYMFTYAKILRYAGDNEHAKDLLIMTIKNDSLALDPHLELAEIYIDEKDLDNALREVDKCLALNPNSLSTLITAGKVYMIRNDIDTAQKFFNRAAKFYPKRPESYFYLGKLKQAQGDFMSAVKQYAQAMRQDADYIPAFNSIINLLINKRNYTAAIDLCNRVIKANPFNAGAYATLAKIHNMQNDQDQAILYYEKALEIDPSLLPVRFHLLQSYINCDMTMNALLQALEIKRIMPNNPAILIKIADIYRDIENYSEAILFYEKALSLEFNYLAAVNCALMHLKIAEDLDKALEYAKLAEASEKDNIDAIICVGRVFLKRGDYSSSAAKFQEALNKDKDNTVCIYHLGLNLYRLGKYEEALSVLTNAIETSTDSEFVNNSRRLIDKINKRLRK